MKKMLIGLVAATAVVAPIAVTAAPADAAARSFANCTAMHKVYAYRGGIKKVGAHDKRTDGGHAKYAPYVSTKRYNLNAKSDRDHDGVACEQ